ncbi:MAG: single-stranded-DNA-specific exonuclease RecJ [Thermoleophilia bacterium]|nr:single-stranded-DNA-specific exonuclease RecJ [Thermoleophilia bacterium]
MGWRADRVAFAEVLALRDALDCPEPLAWTLVRRGLGDPAAAREFMANDGPLADPEALDGIGPAADRLVLALRRGETIAVHGDYDCDGVCSTAVLARSLRGAGGEVVPFLPSRFTDGYGVRTENVELLADQGVTVLCTVDCGTTAEDALTRAVELGMDVIICDHHLAGGARPPGILANPALGRPQEDLPAAVGVVFMLVRALAARLGEGLLGPHPEEELDLVALATVADQVPLIGQNRRLVARGLEVLRKAPRPGIRALCRAAGIDPRTLTARDLGFQLGPTINAAGRMRHAMEALDLVLAPDEETAGPIAERLWALNVERREVEQRITAEAIAQVEASPDEIRDGHAIVAAGDGWHEGVVGIVASRLVERFDRPAIVIARDGDVAKGSGRSLPGVDLHDLVSRADSALTRWGGHAGAIGLQLDPAHIARFRDELLEAARGISGVIDRARVRTVDAVVGARDLTVGSAEAFEVLAPFGRGNPSVRLLMPGCTAEGAGTVGANGRHLQVRLRCGGAHSRAVGFGHGHRAARIEDGQRFDAHVSLGVERFQGFVGPRVVIERLEPVTRGRGTVARDCAAACDLACTARRGLAEVRRLLASGPDAPEAPPAEAAAPLGVRDHRGEGSAMSRIAALAGADGGVVVVTADAARRRAALEEVLQPDRIGVELAVLGGGRCDPAALAGRLAQLEGRPAIAMLDHGALPGAAIPAGMHLAVLDPPWDAHQAGWIRHHAGGRFLHLLWGEPETGFARMMAAARWDVRATAAAVWPGLRDGAPRAWDGALEELLLGAPGLPLREPAAVADALGALAELGLLHVSDDGLRAQVPAPRRDLADAPRAAECVARLAGAEEFLERGGTLDLLEAGPLVTV